jgi:sugar O-acyltransferase (sialic acid O-acetyltransferase NeuD family)
MKDIVIYGSGGLAREVAHLIEIINSGSQEWNILGFIDDNEQSRGKIINGYEVLGGIEWFETNTKQINVAPGIGSPSIKRKIINKVCTYDNIDFPNIIHPDVNLAINNKIGYGNIICEGSTLTCNIIIGNFVTINLNCTVGHDSILDDFCTISPNSSISGNVHLFEGVDFGTNATIIQGISVGRYSIIGAGSVILKDIPENCTAVGMPAKPIKYHDNEILQELIN